MVTSIGKISKSFFVKLLVGIIILPFVFWGMGDVFRGGNQNVIATIDSKKISTQEFVNYLNRLNLNEEQIKNLPKTDLMEKILSEYIGRSTNNIAEYSAIKYALIKASDPGSSRYEKIFIYSDSNLAVQQLNGKWKVKRTSKEGVTTEREGHWSTHNIKVGGSWKMTLDHTNDLKNYNQ